MVSLVSIYIYETSGMTTKSRSIITKPVLDFSHYKVRPYGRSCTPFSVLKQSISPTVGSNVIVGEILHII